MEAPTPSLNADSCIASVPTQQFLLSDLKPDIAFSWLHGHEKYDCISLYNWFYTCWSLSSRSCFPDRNTEHAFTLCQTVIILEIYEESIGMQPDAPTLAWTGSITSRNIKGVSKANHYCTSLSCNWLWNLTWSSPQQQQEHSHYQRRQLKPKYNNFLCPMVAAPFQSVFNFNKFIFSTRCCQKKGPKVSAFLNLIFTISGHVIYPHCLSLPIFQTITEIRPCYSETFSAV